MYRFLISFGEVEGVKAHPSLPSLVRLLQSTCCNDGIDILSRSFEATPVVYRSCRKFRHQVAEAVLGKLQPSAAQDCGGYHCSLIGGELKYAVTAVMYLLFSTHLRISEVVQQTSKIVVMNE